ncbi:MAG: hypothetical protein IIA68_03340 [Proteobacteria bacterium]|nr:hypothetical protein [Pseudomonadota bacterium]
MRGTLLVAAMVIGRGAIGSGTNTGAAKEATGGKGVGGGAYPAAPTMAPAKPGYAAIALAAIPSR